MAADLNNAIWSETDASNTSATAPGWPVGMLPSGVRPSDQAMMGAMKRDWNRRGPTLTSGGSANTQTLTYSVAPTAYVRGDAYTFVAGFTNSGATTLNVNTLGTIAIQRKGAALVGGEIQAGATYAVMLDTTSTCQILNPETRTTAQSYSAAQYFAEATVTHASPTTWNLATQQNGVWTITASVTLSNPTNMVAGQSGNLRIIQGSGGSKLITWGSLYLFPGAVEPTLSTAAAAVDVLSYYTDGTSMYCVLNKAFG